MAPESQVVDVYFAVGDGTDCAEVMAFPRRIGPDEEPVAAAFAELIAGPIEEEAGAGATSFFSIETAAVIRSVQIIDGLAVVDFVDLRPVLPNASTSCGSAALLAQLNGTAFQFDAVRRTRYEIDGSCEAFGNWLQRDCFESDRSGSSSSSDIPTDGEGASGSGCTTDVVDGLADGRWFGFVSEADVDGILFDLACWYSGPAAIVAAAEDGEESPPPNDYHIRNSDDRLRAVAVDIDAEVSWLAQPADPASLVAVSYETWLASRLGRPFQPGIWLDVIDGRVASMEEQYVP